MTKTAYNRWVAGVSAEELKAIRDKHDAVESRMTEDQKSTIESIVRKRHHTRLDVDVLMDMAYDSSLTLGLACKLGHVRAVDILLSRGVFIPLNALNAAISSGNLIVIVIIIEAGCCLTPEMYGFPSPMETAIKTGTNDNILHILDMYGIN